MVFWAGAEPDIFILGGGTGGASFATRGAVNGLCRTFRKRPENFWGGHWGGQAKFWGGSGPPGTSLAPPLVLAFFRRPKKRIEKAKRDAGNKVMVSL